MKKNIVKISIIIVICMLCVALCVFLVNCFLLNRDYDKDVISSADTDSEDDGEINAELDSAVRRITLNIGDNVPAELDAERFVKQVYELKYRLAVNSFEKPEDISVSALVQYAFCYIYAGDKCICELKPGSMLYREATVAQVTEKITELFGSCPVDVTKSDLYISGKDIFQMWQPNYYADIYAAATVRALSENEFEIISTYYEDASKDSVKATLTATVKQSKSGSFYLAGFS